MATFITRLDQAGRGPRIAVKDLIDVAGIPTTAGCKAAGLVAGMMLLEPGFATTGRPASRIGRLRPRPDQTDPRIDTAVDDALRASELQVVDLGPVDWADALMQTYVLLTSEAAAADAGLMADPASAAGISAPVRSLLELGASVTAAQEGAARAYQREWQALFTEFFRQVDAIALPTVPFFPPPLAEAEQHDFTQLTAPVNLAGLPALALPVPSEHRLPASLQLIGPANGEEMLLATGAVLEESAG